ncbi:hypothetical protein RGQ21_64150 [Kitasatospora aureofaciens]|nr:hypothetical protein RGQ21_64150 [Kitasatospora aureofaciens]
MDHDVIQDADADGEWSRRAGAEPYLEDLHLPGRRAPANPSVLRNPESQDVAGAPAFFGVCLNEPSTRVSLNPVHAGQRDAGDQLH